MAITSFPFDTGLVYEAQWTKMARLFRQTGVINEGNKFEVYADSSGMLVKVKSGEAWLRGHYVQSDATETMAIDNSHATLNRIDRIVLRLDWANNTITIAVLKGTSDATPSAPALTQTAVIWEISLAQVAIDAAVVVIDAGDVTDERTFSQGTASAHIQLFGASGTLSTTDGATSGTKIELATNKQNLNNYPSFPNGAKKYIEWECMMPDDWDGGPFTAQYFWTANSTSTNSVVWGMAACCYADNDALDRAWGTAVEVTDANGSAVYTERVSAVSAPITPAGTPAAGQSIHFRAYRLGSGADNLAVAALLKWVVIRYTRVP